MSKRKNKIVSGPTPDLKAWLRDHPGEVESLELRRHEVQGLSDLVHTLQQSNDMLRRQNRKVRKRMLKLRESGAGTGAEDQDLDAFDLDGDLDGAPDGPVPEDSAPLPGRDP